MHLNRSSGILLPVFSLPSKYGIGTFGKAAYKFIDFLADAGQKYWQLLPLGPTSYGDSPYQSLSSFAGNPYFVDFDLLIKDGLLKKSEVDSKDWGHDPAKVDYGTLYQNRYDVLRIAAGRGLDVYASEYAEFVRENTSWLPDYALFMALKKHFDMKPWTEWPDPEIRRHAPDSCEKWRLELRDDVEFYSFVQFLFFRQWKDLKKYAEEKGIGIIGDMPIYVALDSADIWAEPQWFQLDEENLPTEVSGVPPDFFNEDGQLWGNPLYKWDALKNSGYGWWIRRVDSAFKLYDVLRIDHFRGLESYWAVPFGEKTAVNGHWVKGPGIDFVSVLTNWFHDKIFIAEDLGYMTPEVRKLLKDSGLPGMKVLEFAFDSREPSDYLPHTYVRNCTCYTGTHDNDTLLGWKKSADKADIAFAVRYLGLNDREGFCRGIIRGGMSSVADLFVAQLQDYLEIGAEGRVNTPGIPEQNWTWRTDGSSLTKKLAREISSLTAMYGR